VEATGTYLGVAIGLGVVAGHGEWVVVVVVGRKKQCGNGWHGVSAFGNHKRCGKDMVRSCDSIAKIL